MTDLGTMGGTASEAVAVSADGSVVVGNCFYPGGSLGFRWTIAEGMQPISTSVGFARWVTDVSADGSVIVGLVDDGNGDFAFRWTQAGGFQDLGRSCACCPPASPVRLSADGNVVVGDATLNCGRIGDTGDSVVHAFRWGGGFLDIHTLGVPGYYNTSSAAAVSRDGSAVVGWGWIVYDVSRPNPRSRHISFLWTPSQGMVELPGLPGGNWAAGLGVSADGTTAVGYAADAMGYFHAVRWVAGLLQSLGTLPLSSYSIAELISSDGSAAVGTASVLDGQNFRDRAFRWTSAGGMQAIGTLGGSESMPTGISADGFIVVGNSTTADGQTHAFIFGDADGDGLRDEWECYGIPYVDALGASRTYLLDIDGDGMSDADPLHQDLFVELDAVGSGGRITQGAVDMVTNAFAIAPDFSDGRHRNPDGMPGIRLHTLRDQVGLACDAPTQLPGESFTSEHRDAYRTSFGTSDEQSQDPGLTAIRAAKRKAYRYGLVYERSEPSLGGLSTGRNGNEFVIMTRRKENSVDIDASDEWMAARFMHELGHNLGLGHGGIDNANFKPNYISIMNYTLAYRLPWNQNFWRLDYSRDDLPPLYEGQLDETVPVSNTAGDGVVNYSNYVMPIFGVPSGTCWERFPDMVLGQPSVWYVSLNPANQPDWNLDCIHSPSISANINNLMLADAPEMLVGGGCVSNCEAERFPGHDDWDNIDLTLVQDKAPFGGQPSALATRELTSDAVEWMRLHLPPPPPQILPCRADFNHTSTLTVQDIFDFLAAYFSNDFHADFNNSGIISVQDIFDFLSEYFAGCP